MPFQKRVAAVSPSSFAEFVGFFTAHAVWQIEGGENVVPLLAHQDGAERVLARVPNDNYEVAAAQAMQKYETIKAKHDCVLCALDTYITLPNKGRCEAITVTACAGPASITLAVPYQSAKTKVGLTIYPPEILDHSGLAIPSFLQYFWHGVDAHAEAAQFWHAHEEGATHG